MDNQTFFNPFENESRFFVDNVILEELGDVNGRSIIDIGCGNGDFLYKLMDRKAEVFGSDISSEVIEVAKKKYPMINFEVDDFTNPVKIPAQKFDVAVLELVVMFVKDVDALLSNVKKVLNDKGEVVVVILHPFIVMKTITKDFDMNYSFEGDYEYFTEKVLKIKSGSVDMDYFSRSISWYVKKFVSAGYIVKDFSEPTVHNAILNLELKISKEIPYVGVFKLGLV